MPKQSDETETFVYWEMVEISWSEVVKIILQETEKVDMTVVECSGELGRLAGPAPERRKWDWKAVWGLGNDLRTPVMSRPGETQDTVASVPTQNGSCFLLCLSGVSQVWGQNQIQNKSNEKTNTEELQKALKEKKK